MSANLLDNFIKINHTEIMRVAARTVFIFFCFVIAFALFSPSAYAQTLNPSPVTSTQTTSTNGDNFLFPNTATDVPRTHHMFTQIELIDLLSAVMCQLTGIDPTNPAQACLGVDPSNGKIGFSPSQSQQFAMGSSSQPQLGGALGVMDQFIGSLYVPAISATQYTGYLADNFGVTKRAYAATNCNTSQFGYGFCGLSPILKLWSQVRDLAYAMLTILFVAIGIGVMFRFRVDPRTVMTLQNQIPRVIISILLITFSFGIAGGMIDVMWTATYAGVNFISSASPSSQINLCSGQQNKPQPINQVVETRLIDQPISFTNTVFRTDSNCAMFFDNGLLNLATKVSDSLGDLIQQLVHDLLFNSGNACHITWWNPLSIIGGAAKCALENGALSVILWLAEFLVKIVIVVTILVSLFRLWFKLITCYVTFLIFVILGPIWIVFGLIPGRPMGFEKLLRIYLGNLAPFPLVAFMIVFARVISDLVPTGTGTPNGVFIPPLIGNTNISTFSSILAFGIIIMLANIVDIVKERLKAKSQANFGAAAGAAIAAGAGIATAVPNQVNKHLNKRDQYGNAIGVLARGKDNAANAIATRAGNVPGLGWVGKQHHLAEAAKRGPEALQHAKEEYPEYRQRQKAFNTARKGWNDPGRTKEDGSRYTSKRDFSKYWKKDKHYTGWAAHEKWAPPTPTQYQRPAQPAPTGTSPLPPLPPPQPTPQPTPQPKPKAKP